MRALWAAVAVLLAAAAAAPSLAGRLLVVADPQPSRADAIVVLAGSIPDRVLEAADLFRAGVAPRVIVTRERVRRNEAALRARGVRLPESDALTVSALERLGIPRPAIVVLRRRTGSTVSEARTIARHACASGLRSLVVVTSRSHSRRARLVLRRVLGPSVALSVRPSRHDVFTATRWWRVRRDAKTVLREYEKLAHWLLRERWTIEPCGGLRRRPRAAGLRTREPGG